VRPTHTVLPPVPLQLDAAPGVAHQIAAGS